MKNILYTRLIRPKSKNVINRNRNIKDKLNTILENKLTVVKGGAAVGKSTLISSYIGDKKNYMWLSLDENSDDLTYFWTYILHGLKNNIEDINFYIDMINPLVNREDIFELISALINELISEDELFIVLDDLHYIEDEFLVETIEYFISNSSDNIHFILISRHDIKLYLGNILMKGGVVDISAEDMYLTLEETEEFIKNTTNKNIGDELIKDIYLNTEGWIGAIKLFITVLGNNKSIKNIPKGNKLFIDYMNNEIISSLSEEEIDFLVKTSILSYVNPAIYNDISGEDGFSIIEKLIEKNMLIIMIDEEKNIFRYHNILRQYLLELFAKYEEKVKNQTIEMVTASLMKDGNFDEAISIFINWDMYDDALKVIERNAHNMVSTKILNEFPVEYYSKSVDLALIAIFSNYLNLDYERCFLIINSVQDSINNDNILKSIKFFSVILDNSSIIDSNVELTKEIDSGLNIFTKIIYYNLSSWALGFFGEYSRALEMIELIKENNKELKNSYIELINKYNRISLLEELGRLNECKEGYNDLNNSINSKNYKSCFTIFGNVGLPGVYIKQLKDKEAEKLLLEAQNLLDALKGRAVYSSLEIGIAYNLAEVRYIQNDIDECERLINSIDRGNKEGYAYIQILALKITLLSTQNKVSIDEYNEFIEIYQRMYNDLNGLGNVGLAYGIVFFELGKYEESLDVFNKIIFKCRKNGIGYSLVYSLLWKVIILNKLKKDDGREQVNLLKEAIFYSRDEEILFPYYKSRKYLKDIIRSFEPQLLDDKDNKDFIKRLKDIMDIRNESEVLSSRELEVLKALIDGLSNKEIGEKLFISISTVKTHIINIYSKLGVKNRVEAVNEGRKIF